MALTERLWRMLPDRCECRGCSRNGVRGNEQNVAGRLVCDYCYRGESNLILGGSWWDRHPRIRWPVAIGFALYLISGAVAFIVAMLR